MIDKPIKQGEIITVKLDNLAYGGETVGRVDNFAVFIPGGIPGEEVRVRITQVKKNYARGKLIEVIKPSSFRINAECDAYAKCGGCQLQHIDYPEQLRLKRQIVVDAIERIAGLKDIVVEPTLTGNRTNYRNKAQFPLGLRKNKSSMHKIITGFYATGTHDIIANESCQIQHPLINRIVKRTLQVLNQEKVSIYNEKLHKGLLRHLLVRVGICTNQAMLVFVTNGRNFPKAKKIAKQIMRDVPELISVQQNINTQKTNVILGRTTELVLGEKNIIDYIGEMKFAISAESFFQVNTLQAKVLYDQVVKYAGLTGSEVVLDAYCGIGTIANYLAKHAQVVHGIEVNQQAIRDAEKNAVLNGLDNLFFYTGLVEQVLPRLTKDDLQFDLVVVDPPRKGLHTDVLKVFCDAKPAKIIYVSCNPTTLARDLKVLVEHGYEVNKVQPVDMFPDSYHVETVVLMSRMEK